MAVLREGRAGEQQMSVPTSALTSHRSPRWVVELLNRDGWTLRTLDGVQHVDITLAATERLGGNATLEIDPDLSGPINFLSDRVRFTYLPQEGGGGWPLGTFLLTSPKEEHEGDKKRLTIVCLHLPAVVDRHQRTTATTIPKGTQIVPWVVNLLVSEVGVPRTQIAVTDLGTVTSGERSWDVKDSTLTIINDLLTSAGYWSLRVDTRGIFQIKPWTPPSGRPPMWEFTKTEVGITSPKWTREQDLSSIPNRVVAATMGTEDTPAIIGVAELTDPEDPLSIPNRGVVGRTYDIEANSQAAATSQAQQLLEGRLDPVLKVEVSHAPVPVEPNDVIAYQVDGQLELFTVQRFTIKGMFSAQTKATWRGVSGRELSEVDGDTD